MKKSTFLQKVFSSANSGAFLLLLGLMSFGAHAQKVPGRVSQADEKWQKGGVYEGFKPAQEDLSKRTKNSKHFRNANGSYTAQVGSAMHYQDNNGAWQDISLALVKNGNAFVNETNSFKSQLPANAGAAVNMKLNNAVNFAWWANPQMQFVSNGNVVKAVSPAHVAGKAGKNKVQYQGIYPGVTEEFVMLKNGIENNTIISELTADIAAMPKSATMQLKQFIPLKAGWEVEDIKGQVRNSGFDAEAFHIAIPGTEEGIYFGSIVAFDSKLSREKAMMLLNTPESKRTAAEKALVKNHIYVGQYAVNFVEGGIEVASKMPVQWLKAAGRQYPVVIDPTVTITPPTPAGNFYCPLSNWYGFQRHADLYLASELNLTTSQITAIEYNKTSGTARTKPATVYMRTTGATALTTDAWNSNTYTGGLTPLFDGNTTQDATAGWKMITLTSPFLYTSGNLIVMVKDIYGGSGSAQNFEESTAITGRQAYKRQDSTDPGDASAMALESYLPSIRLTYNTVTVTCEFPTNVTFPTVTSTGATVNWVAPANAPANGYEYIVSTSPVPPAETATPDGSTGAGITTANLTLSPNTTYYVYVRGVCGTDKSFWTAGSVTTLCAAFPAPFTEAFTSGAKPTCWFNTSTSGVPNALWKFTGAADAPNNTRASGTYAWVDGSDPVTGVNDVTLTSPQIDLSTITNPHLTFDYFSNNTNTSATANSTLTVSVYNGSVWTPVYTNNTNNPAWRTVRVPLTAYAGMTITVRFVVDKTTATTGSAANNDILLDNFAIQAGPACAPPSELLVVPGVSTADASWATPAAAPADGYEYEVRTSGAAGSGATGLVTSGTSASAAVSQSISGLPALASLTLYIRSACGNGVFSDWTSVAFNTIPGNDNCAGAIALTVNPNYNCGTTTNGSTVGATLSQAAAPCSGTPDDDVWFSFVATGDKHRVTISNIVAVTGTSVDMYFQVLSGACGSLTSVVCSDPNETNLTGLTAGNTYYVRVYSYGTTTRNTFKICIGSPPPPPVNDDCANAVALTVNPALTCTATTTGTTQSATNSLAADPCLGNPDDDVWYSFVATASQHRISLTNVTAVEGSSTDMYFQVLSGACGSGTSLLCSDPDAGNVSGLTPGETYYVRVYSFSATSRQNFTICVATLPAPPANDECAAAVALTVNPDYSCVATTNATTAGASNSLAAAPCNGNPDDDVWFSFVATGAAHKINISNVTAVIGTGTDMYFQVLSGACDGTTSVLCSDPNENTVTGLTPGETYYIRVYTYAAGGGASFTICVGTQPDPPVNDDCESAIELTVNPDFACGVTTTGTTVSAGLTMAAAPCGGNPDDDVWYTFVATSDSHRVSLSGVSAVVGTSTDMYFQVLEGACGQFTSKLCSDPDNNTVTGLTAGDTYYIRVYTYGANNGANFTICIGTLPEPPANDDCEGAVALTVNATNVCTVTTTGTTAAASNSMAAAPCSGNPDDDVWYTFTATSASHIVTLSNVTAVVGTSTDMYFQVLSGACGATTSVVCSDPNTSTLTGLNPGETYFIRVYTFGAANAANFTICIGTPPPPPANDDCSGAIALTPGSVFGTNPLVATNVSATNSANIPAPGCVTNTIGGDVWYSVVVPASGNITVETNANTGSSVADTVLTLYSGACGSLVLIECDDDDSEDGNFSKVVLTGRTPGEVIYARTWEYGNDTTGNWRISAYDASLSNPDFESGAFRHYPNPVKDVLNLSSVNEITSVAIYNMLGQQMMVKNVNTTEAAVDMSQLADGAYIVNVTAGNSVKTIKVVKKQ